MDSEKEQNLTKLMTKRDQRSRNKKTPLTNNETAEDIEKGHSTIINEMENEVEQRESERSPLKDDLIEKN